MLDIDNIRIDGGTQSRIELVESVISEYADHLAAGETFPPVVAFFDGADHWLADGFHRYFSHKKLGLLEIAADIRAGTRRDAVLFSVGANGQHGLRRTNFDKRKAVETLLKDAEWSKWSDREISRQCSVSHEFVRQTRNAICQPLTDAKPETRTVERNGKTYEQKIGKARPENHEEEQADAIVQPLPKVVELTKEREHDELREAISVLAEENERLSDRLAVEAMDASEEEKTSAANELATLRARVKILEAELSAVKASRDAYMRDANEMQKQIKFWRKKAEGVSA